MNQISAALLQATANATVGPAISLFKKLGSDAYTRLATKFGKCFQGHVNHTYARCSRIKNIIYRDASADFLSQYVAVSFKQGNLKINDSELQSLLLSGKNILISGRAGTGKTMFMRWAALDFLITHKPQPILEGDRALELSEPPPK